MSTGTVATSAAEALAVLRAGVDGLLDADLSGLSGVEVAELLSSLEVQRRRLEPWMWRWWPRPTGGVVAGEDGQTGAAELVMMPPRRLDPDQRPRRNTTHHLPDHTPFGNAQGP